MKFIKYNVHRIITVILTLLHKKSLLHVAVVDHYTMSLNLFLLNFYPVIGF